MKIILEPAFVLHTIPYRETSLIVKVFTQNFGLIDIIAKSARGPRSRFKGNLIPFSPLLITCTGRTELLQLNAVETKGASYFLQGNNIFNALYLNELLVKLLHRHDSFPNLFLHYQAALVELQQDKEPQKILRCFEKNLLSELGYGLQLSKEVTGKMVLPNELYSYHLEQGVVPYDPKAKGVTFRGSHLLAIDNNNFDSHEILKDARQLLRFVLGNLLGKKEIKTRELFA